MKTYKIGEFSKYLGVTADFIKYYEQLDVVFSEKTTVPKRYAFNNAGKVIECLRLRNCGFRSREIQQIFDSVSVEDLEAMMLQNTERLKKEIMLREVCYQEQKRLTAWAKVTKHQSAPYAFLELPPLYFLHHTNADNFVDNPEVFQALPSWMEWLPAVKSARKLNFAHSQAEAVSLERQWGFLIEKKFAEQNGLTVNAACQLIPAQRVFCYRLYDAPTHVDPHQALQDALCAVAENNVNITGEVIQEILLRYNDSHHTRCWSNIYFFLQQE